MAEVKLPPVDDQKEERANIRKVGGAKIRKNPGRKFSDLFFEDDIETIKGYVLFDVVIPAIKNTIVDIVTNGVEMLFWGDSSPRKSSRRRREGYTSYDSYYGSTGSERCRKASRRDEEDRQSARVDYRDLIFGSRDEAEDVLQSMIENLAVYHQVTVAELFESAGVTGNGFTDNKWGWTNLDGVTTRRIRDGYILELPQAKDLT